MEHTHEPRQATRNTGLSREQPALAVLEAVAVGILLVTVWLVASPPDSPTGRAGTALAQRDDLMQLATRGSLAGEPSWLHGVTRVDALSDLPAERHVVFAGDLVEERVALVLAEGSAGSVAAWLTGPVGAPPQRMSLVAPPTPARSSGPVALWDTPRSAWLGGVLVVVTMPGDGITFIPGGHVDAFGRQSDRRQHFPADDGVATVAVGAPTASDLGEAAAARVVVDRRQRELVVEPLLSDRARRLADAPVEPADPRGLRAGVDERHLQAALHELVGTYGLPPRQLSPTLLAAGPLDQGGGAAVLVGATMPSGATVASLSIEGGSGDPIGGRLSTTPAPAGRALLDRLVAVWAAPRAVTARPYGTGTIVISGPRAGTVVEALGADGRTLTSAPLAEGAGVVALPAVSIAVRIRDARGVVLAEGPITGPIG